MHRARDLKGEIDRIRWFHQIDLGHGVVTPGIDPSAARLPQYALPRDLSGKSVLDIGAWDGFFSFEVERRGAARVVALDSYVWRSPLFGRDGFDLARRTLGSKVEDVELEVLEIGPEKLGTFDLVIFSGVLYHMRHPLLALERVASVCAGQLILETHVDLLGCERPALAFYPGTELDGDGSNWFGPNPAAIDGMLRCVGFSRVEQIGQPTQAPREMPGASPQDFGRVVFHAWR